MYEYTQEDFHYATDQEVKQMINEKTINIPATMWERLIYAIDEMAAHGLFIVNTLKNEYGEMEEDIEASIEEFKSSRALCVEELNRIRNSVIGAEGYRATIAEQTKDKDQ